MPHLRTLVERYKDDPFVLIGVNQGDSPDTFRSGIKEYEHNWDSIYTPPGDNPIVKMFRIRGFPTYFLIDADGTIVSSSLRGERLDRKIEELVTKAKGAK